MTEEVTSQLSKLSGLRVIGRTAVAQFKEPRSRTFRHGEGARHRQRGHAAPCARTAPACA